MRAGAGRSRSSRATPAAWHQHPEARDALTEELRGLLAPSERSELSACWSRRRLLAGRGRVVLLDVRWALGDPHGRENYLAGHLPGAVFVDLETELADPPSAAEGRHPLPVVTATAVSGPAVGDPDGDRVVAYDASGGLAAARAWWLLRWGGLPDVRLLDGGLDAWLRAGGRLETGDVVPEPGRRDADRRRDAGAVDRRRRGAGRTQAVLLDARAGERYRGEVEPIDPRAGHVPGAVSAPTTENLDPRRELQAGRRTAGQVRRAGCGRAATRRASTAAPGSPRRTRWQRWPSPASTQRSGPGPGRSGRTTRLAPSRPGPGDPAGVDQIGGPRGCPVARALHRRERRRPGSRASGPASSAGRWPTIRDGVSAAAGRRHRLPDPVPRERRAEDRPEPDAPRPDQPPRSRTSRRPWQRRSGSAPGTSTSGSARRRGTSCWPTPRATSSASSSRATTSSPTAGSSVRWRATGRRRSGTSGARRWAGRWCGTRTRRPRSSRRTAARRSPGAARRSTRGPGQHRLHFDLGPPADGDQQAEVDRLLALGATRIDDRPGESGRVLMADPDGNEFCLWPTTES